MTGFGPPAAQVMEHLGSECFGKVGRQHGSRCPDTVGAPELRRPTGERTIWRPKDLHALQSDCHSGHVQFDDGRMTRRHVQDVAARSTRVRYAARIACFHLGGR